MQTRELRRSVSMGACLSIMLCLLVASTTIGQETLPERPPRTIRVAGIVLKWVRTDRDANYRRVEPLIRRAADAGAKIVCTTESFLDGYSIADKTIPLDEFRALGEEIPDGAYFKRLQEMADDLDIYLVAGILERDGDRLFNTAVVIDPEGRLLGKYHKQKLGHEAVRVTPGEESRTFETSLEHLGVMICADRRDKQVVRRFCDNGAKLLICPSGGMFGPERNDPFLQARSRENSKYIVFVHPAEFLVTAPDGSIAKRILVGNQLVLDQTEVGTASDSSGVFLYDVPVEDRGREPGTMGEDDSRTPLEQITQALKRLIDDNMSLDDAPEFFCFGLLKAFDIRQLKALVSPRPITEHASNQ